MLSEMAFLPAYRLKLYRNFKAIDASDYHGIVRYYEQFEEAIGSLDMEEYLDCTWTYTNALFETGNFGQHLVMCDHLLELVIMHNIETWGGEDIYAKLLFKKAAALYQTQEYAKSAYVLRELVKIYPGNPVPRRFLCACLRRQKPRWLFNTRAVAMALTFLTAGLIALELFVVHPFFPKYYQPTLIAHNILLAAAVGTLAAGEALHHWKCYQEAARFACRMRARKSGDGLHTD